MLNYIIKNNFKNKLYSIYISVSLFFHGFSNFQKNQDYIHIVIYVFLYFFILFFISGQHNQKYIFFIHYIFFDLEIYYLNLYLK
jgi:hypothetical protein